MCRLFIKTLSVFALITAVWCVCLLDGDWFGRFYIVERPLAVDGQADELQ